MAGAEARLSGLITTAIRKSPCSARDRQRHQPIESAHHPTLQIIDWLREHDDEAHRIALAGQAFAQRHLTRPGRLCYLRKLLHTYASLLRCRC